MDIESIIIEIIIEIIKIIIGEIFKFVLFRFIKFIKNLIKDKKVKNTNDVDDNCYHCECYCTCH